MEKGPVGKMDPRKLVNIQGSPPSSSKADHPTKQEVRQKCQRACMDDQGVPGQIQTQKGNIQGVEERTSVLR